MNLLRELKQKSAYYQIVKEYKFRELCVLALRESLETFSWSQFRVINFQDRFTYPKDSIFCSNLTHIVEKNS